MYSYLNPNSMIPYYIYSGFYKDFIQYFVQYFPLPMDLSRTPTKSINQGLNASQQTALTFNFFIGNILCNLCSAAAESEETVSLTLFC